MWSSLQPSAYIIWYNKSNILKVCYVEFSWIYYQKQNLAFIRMFSIAVFSTAYNKSVSVHRERFAMLRRYGSPEWTNIWRALSPAVIMKIATWHPLCIKCTPTESACTRSTACIHSSQLFSWFPPHVVSGVVVFFFVFLPLSDLTRSLQIRIYIRTSKKLLASFLLLWYTNEVYHWYIQLSPCFLFVCFYWNTLPVFLVLRQSERSFLKSGAVDESAGSMETRVWEW